jgi:3-oxoacyl-[acyl-carrier-protein] synthase II
MLADDDPSEFILVGAADELIDASFIIQQRMGIFPNESVSGITHKTKAGEGVSFFLLSRSADILALPYIAFSETVFNFDSFEVAERIKTSLTRIGLLEPDLILAGFNGSYEVDLKTKQHLAEFGFSSPIRTFKNACGEYGTATAFAMWMACNLLSNEDGQQVPIYSSGTPPQNVLIFNVTTSGHCSFTLLMK